MKHSNIFVACRAIARAFRHAVLLGAAFGSAACGASRQSPPETVPDAYRPDGTPVRQEAPPPPIRRIEPRSEEIRAPFHFAVFLDAQSVNLRAYEGMFLLPNRQPTLISLDATMQKLSGVGPGVGLRLIRGAGKVPEFAEGVVIFGTRRIAGDFGVATRAGPHLFRGGAYDSTYALLRVGGRSRINLGESGFSLHLRGAKYIPMPAPGTTEKEVVGWSAETGLSWTWAPVPVSLNLGYRYEKFRVRDRRQEVSGLTLGTGFLFGRR